MSEVPLYRERERVLESERERASERDREKEREREREGPRARETGTKSEREREDRHPAPIILRNTPRFASPQSSERGTYKKTRPDSGLGFQVKVLKPFSSCAFLVRKQQRG